MLNKKEFHVQVDEENSDNSNVVTIMAGHTGLSKQSVKQAMKKGAFWIEDAKGIRRLRRADTVPPRQATLHLYYSEVVLNSVPPVPTLISDESDYSVWFKPSNMFSQGSKWGDHCTINRWIEGNQPFENMPQRNCFIVNRLDRAARGLMLIAHKKNAAVKLSGLFEGRKINKNYRVIVEGQFPMEERIMDSPIDDKEAYSVANCLDYSKEKNRSLLDVGIKTGRKHQIRIHLSRAGYPVVGDDLHGIARDQVASSEELQLSSYSLEFLCPISQDKKLFILPSNLQLVL